MKIKLIVPIIIMFIMTSCTQVIVDRADEVRMNKWSARLNNGSVVSLSFKNDDGFFKIKSKDEAARAVIKGLSIIDDKSILIYNNDDNEPYCFDYKIRNNTITLKYDGGAVSLTRKIDNKR